MAAWTLLIIMWGSGSSFTASSVQVPMATEAACSTAADQVHATEGGRHAYTLCLKTGA